MEESIGQIKSKISRFQKDTAYVNIRTRWNKDLNLFRLKPYNAGSGYFSYTTNSPRNLAVKALSMLSEAKLMIRVPEDILTEEERETASNVERLLYGAFNLNDERYARIPDMPSLREQMAWYAVIRGGFAILPYVYKNEKGDTQIHIAVWDIYNTAYGIGSNGTLWAAHTRKASREEVVEEYGIKGSNAEVDITDYWTEKENGVIVGGEWGKDEKHGLDHNPVTIMKVGATPKVWQDNYSYTGTLVGESIFSSNRDLYPIYNKTISDLLTLVRRGVKTPIGVWSRGGVENIEDDIWQTEKAVSVPIDSGKVEKIEELIKSAMPNDAKDLVNIASGDLQRGGISHVAEGELGFRLSGFAINQLQAQLSTVIVPFARCLEQAYTVACTEIIDQYADGKWKPVKVRGRTGKNQPFGIPKAIEIKPSNIEGNWHPELELMPMLPKDDAQRYELARMAQQGGFMSLETIQDSLLEIEDTKLEQEKMSQEWAESLPFIKLYNALLASLADGRQDKAMMIIAELQQLLAARGGQQQAQQPQGGGGVPNLEAMAAGMPGVGAPPGKTGLSPEVMPSEQMGGLPPGSQNAQMNLFGSEV